MTGKKKTPQTSDSPSILANAKRTRSTSKARGDEETAMTGVATIDHAYSVCLPQSDELYQQQLEMVKHTATGLKHQGDLVAAMALNGQIIAKANDPDKSLAYINAMLEWNKHPNQSLYLQVCRNVSMMKVAENTNCGPVINVNAKEQATSTQYRLILKPKAGTNAIMANAYDIFDYATRDLPIQFTQDDRSIEPTFWVRNQAMFSAAYAMMQSECTHEGGPLITSLFDIEKRIVSAYAIVTQRIEASLVWRWKWIKDRQTSAEANNSDPQADNSMDLDAGDAEGATGGTPAHTAATKQPTQKILRTYVIDEQLMTADILKPNRALIFSAEDIEGLEIKDAFEKLSDGRSAVVIRIALSKACFMRFNDAGRDRQFITIDRKPYYIYQDIKIRQCNRCFQFDHYGGKCSLTYFRCKFCGISSTDPAGHRSNECGNKKQPRCFRCIELNAETGGAGMPAVRFAHHAASAECPLVDAERKAALHNL